MAATKIYDKHKAGPDQIRSDPDDRYTRTCKNETVHISERRLIHWPGMRGQGGGPADVSHPLKLGRDDPVRGTDRVARTRGKGAIYSGT